MTENSVEKLGIELWWSPRKLPRSSVFFLNEKEEPIFANSGSWFKCNKRSLLWLCLRHSVFTTAVFHFNGIWKFRTIYSTLKTFNASLLRNIDVLYLDSSYLWTLVLKAWLLPGNPIKIRRNDHWPLIYYLIKHECVIAKLARN